MAENKKEPEEVAGQEETPEEEGVSVGYEELSRIDRIFREKYPEILEGIAVVLKEYEIEGYRVTGVTFEPPNPSLCLPYVRYVPGTGVVVGVSCFDD